MSATDLAFQTYLTALRKTPLDQKTEHTDRTALETLLNTLAPTKTHVQHEPKRADDKGSPDFKVTTGANAILGYVEVKTIGENLDRVLKSPQIVKYKSLSTNIILTDYLHFIWISGDNIERHSLAFASDLENPRHKINPVNAAAVAALIAAFFSVAPAGLSRAQDLALALATRAHLLRDGLTAELDRQQAQHQQGKLYGLLGAFRKQVFHELTLAEFADAFAQMLAYGLFLARLNTDATLTLANARDYIPAAFPLIRELIDFTKELNEPDYAQIRWIVEEILSIMNSLNLADIRQDLSFANRKSTMRKVRAGSEEEHRLFERDPFVYFYEDFLAKYDAKLRKSRGVYYTPPPVVNFIIRAIDDILKTEFAIPTGLADHNRVTLLDFATGTGTFLLEAFERMFETIGEGKRDLLVREHILKNVFGFEYLIAPYTIAHLKLSQYLADKGHKLAGNERLQIYLTNTLEPIEPAPNLFLPELSRESEKAQEIKRRPILVITGNPPYSGHSKNKGSWITEEVFEYKKGFPELDKPGQGKWLQDDYVKFIRFAQIKLDKVEEGVVGIITNHSFQDNPTFCGMRFSLMNSFEKIFVLDLHGSTKKKEKAPDGSKDENVFDNEQGVAISLFVKTKTQDAHRVWRSDFWGTRQAKYEACVGLSLNKIKWEEVRPGPPFYLFTHSDSVLEEGYRQGTSVPEIFGLSGDPAPGVVTTQDQFAISFTPAEAREKVKELLASPDEAAARRKFRLCSQKQWNYQTAKKELMKVDLNALIKPILYRPFDTRLTVWNRNVAVHRRERVMRHMLHENVALVTSRLTKGEPFRHVQARDKVAEVICMSPTTSNNGFVFPLYLYHDEVDNLPTTTSLFKDKIGLVKDRIENISRRFRTDLNTRYGTPYFTPEQVFGYIYAILHAPTYRTRYAEFLRGDFPRIPLAPTRAAFESLATLGWDLAQKHLLKLVPANPVSYKGKGDNTVEKPRYAETEQAVYINATQSFAPVPEPVWNFHIGGYQVIDKYLKSRKGRTLTLDEVTTVEQIVTVLAFTITQMQAIDTIYKSAFPTAG